MQLRLNNATEYFNIFGLMRTHYHHFFTYYICDNILHFFRLEAVIA